MHSLTEGCRLRRQWLIRLGRLRAASVAVTLFTLYLICFTPSTMAADTPLPPSEDWLAASQEGRYDDAVDIATRLGSHTPLTRILLASAELKLADTAQWRAFLHYKPAFSSQWLSQVDSEHFFLSERGKTDPESELAATLAAFYATDAKTPLRLSAYCRFVARRYWLAEQLPDFVGQVPEQPCPEFDRYVDYLDADSLTMIFPTSHPNSPSSAFGHTLLRIDKKDQRPESRLLNMSINFAAEVPPDVSGAAYAIGGLAGGFPGKFRLLPYHMKLREYGQIENRDTWEYSLDLDKGRVDLVLRHAYEMLISHYDYYFFSENCSYHLLSLLGVAYPDAPLNEHFGLWTIPVDTIRLLNEQNLISDVQFVPSAIRTLRARRQQLEDTEGKLALDALENGLDSIDNPLSQLSPERQAAVLDLLSDYERYNRLKTDPSALGTSGRERAILSRRSKLGVKTELANVTAPATSPDKGHGTSRVGLQYHRQDKLPDTIEFQFRPAYHDFRDPSAAFDDKAAIEMGLIGIAQDLEADRAFLRRFTLLSIESIEPRGDFFQPVSWHTNLKWERPHSDARHEFTFNTGAGLAFQASENAPAVFVFGESDLVDAPGLEDRRQWRVGASAGVQWEPVNRLRMGLELDYRHQVGNHYYEAGAEGWLGIALADNWSLNVDIEYVKLPNVSTTSRLSAGIRTYF